MTRDICVTADLAEALLDQARDTRPPRPATPRQEAALNALLAAYGTSENDVSGIAMLAGRQLLVIHAGKPSTQAGVKLWEPEIRALGEPPRRHWTLRRLAHRLAR